MPDSAEFYIRAVNQAIERDADGLAFELAEGQRSIEPEPGTSKLGPARRLLSAANNWTLVSFNPPWSRRQDAA